MQGEFTPGGDSDASHTDAGTGPEVPRRTLLRGAAVSGLALPLLVACTSDTDTAAPTSSPEESAGGTTVAASDVPVGGGTILQEELIVVTQPVEGEYKAFSAVCTHQGCPVQEVSDGRISCNCHGSAFSIEDGSVVKGPATEPLEEKSLSVEGDSLTVT